MDLVFKIKVDGKFKTVAKFAKNKFGNKQFSLNKALFKSLFAGEGDWIDLSVFENEEGGKAEGSSALPQDQGLEF